MTADEKTLGEQMTTWQIGESGTELVLDGDGEGEITFTVTNASEAQDRAVLTITPLDGAADSWFTVDEPQRAVGPGASVVYAVKVRVPPGTAAGSFGMQGVAYSADTDPSESSVTSKRVGITVPPPPPKKGIPRWVYIVIAAVLLLIIGLIAFFLTRGGGGLANEQPPAIDGDVAVLETLTASEGEWSEDVEVATEWQRCDRDGDGCETIEGAVGPVFTPGLEDVNLTLRVQVTATSKDDEDETAVATSELTAPVDGANLGNAEVPRVIDLPSSAASRTLGADFTVRVERSTTSVLAPSCDPIVVDQRPAPTTIAPRGSEVTIVTGPKIVNIKSCLLQVEEELAQGVLLVDDPPVPIPEELFRRAAEASR